MFGMPQTIVKLLVVLFTLLFTSVSLAAVDEDDVTYPFEDWADGAEVYTDMLQAVQSAMNSDRMDWKLGAWCGPLCPHKWRVTNNVPVMYIEVIKKESDSVLKRSSGGSPSTNTTVVADGKWENRFEVKIWEITQIMRDLGAYMDGNPVFCAMCKPSKTYLSASRVADHDIWESTVAEIVPSKFVPGGCPTPLLDAGEIRDKAYSRIEAFIKAAVPSLCLPKLLFSTAWVGDDWHDKCTDCFAGALMGPVCEARSALEEVFGNIPGAESIFNSLNSSYGGCVGSWGSVYPRQANVGKMAIDQAAALTAWRAMHYALFTYGTLPYYIKGNEFLQPVYPNMSRKLRKPGQSYISQPITMDANHSPVGSGHFGFIYWQKRRCWKGVDEVALTCAGGGLVDDCLT